MSRPKKTGSRAGSNKCAARSLIAGIPAAMVLAGVRQIRDDHVRRVVGNVFCYDVVGDFCAAKIPGAWQEVLRASQTPGEWGPARRADVLAGLVMCGVSLKTAERRVGADYDSDAYWSGWQYGEELRRRRADAEDRGL